MPDPNRQSLLKFITKHYDLEELRTLCFNLEVNFDGLRGEGLEGKARELILDMERDGRLPDLAAALARERPEQYLQAFGATPQPQPRPKTEPAPVVEKKPEPTAPEAKATTPGIEHELAPRPAAAGSPSLPGKPLYWLMGVLGIIAVTFLGWRLILDGRLGGQTPNTSNSSDAPTTTLDMVTPVNNPILIETPAAAPQAGDSRLITLPGGVEVEQVYVPAGSFMMGSEEGQDDERPLHEVTLDAFWIDRMEVTNQQYAECVYAGECNSPRASESETRDIYLSPEFAEYPVMFVTWSYAADYCNWVSGRLPTEAEWEYAARGRSNYKYPWGNNAPDCSLANYDRECVGDTWITGFQPDGASWVGALDMAGNVWEWVNDRYDENYYNGSPRNNPPGPADSRDRVVRGGAWSGNGSPESSNRNKYPPGAAYNDLGFRCVHD